MLRQFRLGRTRNFLLNLLCEFSANVKSLLVDEIINITTSLTEQIASLSFKQAQDKSTCLSSERSLRNGDFVDTNQSWQCEFSVHVCGRLSWIEFTNVCHTGNCFSESSVGHWQKPLIIRQIMSMSAVRLMNMCLLWRTNDWGQRLTNQIKWYLAIWVGETNNGRHWVSVTTLTDSQFHSHVLHQVLGIH